MNETVLLKFYNDKKAQASLPSIAVGVLAFLIIMVVYGQIASTLDIAIFGGAVIGLLGLIPMVLVGAALVLVVVAAFR